MKHGNKYSVGVPTQKYLDKIKNYNLDITSASGLDLFFWEVGFAVLRSAFSVRHPPTPRV